MSGYALALAGERDNAQNVLNELEVLSLQRHIPSNSMAVIHAALGQNDAAFARLEQAYQERDVCLSFLNVDPKWEIVRSDPRFAELVSRLGLKSAV